MSIVYRKTGKGVAEIETRALRLAPRPRSALILVDGRKTDDELALLILNDPKETFASLLADGFIEVLTTLADRPAERKSATPTSPTTRPAAGAGNAFETLRRDAVRELTNQMGPAAETVAIKIERAKTLPELQPLLVQGAKMLRSFRGTAAAEAFAARFIAETED